MYLPHLPFLTHPSIYEQTHKWPYICWMTFFIFILLITSLLFKFATKFFLHVVPSFQTPCQCCKDCTTLKLYLKACLYKYLTFEPTVWSLSVIPFWSPQNVSFNISYYQKSPSTFQTLSPDLMCVIFFRRPMRSNEATNNQHFFRRPMRSNGPTNNQHFIVFLFSKIATKPNRPWSNWHLKLLQLTIRLNDRGKERFRETLVELSIETNSNYSGMRHK